jgi:hypothetical protein
MSNHLGDTNKMVDTPRMKAAQMAAMEHMTGDVYRVGCDIERELNAAQQRIKRLEEAGNNLLWNFCPEYTSDLTQEQSDALKQWNKAKEAKP